MKWGVAEAKVRFSELLRAAGTEPQLIYNRERPVAAVVDPETFDAFETWRKTKGRESVAKAFESLQEILNEGAYVIEAPTRIDRRNTFIGALDDVSV